MIAKKTDAPRSKPATLGRLRFMSYVAYRLTKTISNIRASEPLAGLRLISLLRARKCNTKTRGRNTKKRLRYGLGN
jgi:hypothetical protein